ncbi:MAG: methyltransferase type 12 [Candidatus Margulisbacteria bacterium GWF2_35_9]|nr:MAG: methyltransferase type 12 [Candidatus Margulisbacteria bacterium GWF2_35_9]
MKYRDSGMPNAEMWETFFDPYYVLKNMEIDTTITNYFDIGCGYGTFLFHASEFVKNAVGYDIDENMISYCQNLKQKYKKANIKLVHGDISTQSSQNILKDNRNAFDYVSLFNLLHCEEPVKLLSFAKELLTDYGRIGVIHWQYKETPRGPSMDIRPRPDQIIQWAETALLKVEKQIDLPPYHYGIIFTK